MKNRENQEIHAFFTIFSFFLRKRLIFYSSVSLPFFSFFLLIMVNSQTDFNNAN